MLPERASRTALGAAKHRAAHQTLERGRIFSDPLAVRILGSEAEPLNPDADSDAARRGLRLFIAARTRFAEDALAASVARGLRQVVILGAGLDTYAYRSPLIDRLRIFEVDHPATQAWKRQRLAEVGISVPETLTFAPIDFERQTLADGLATVSFRSDERTFFTWLGVVPYLTEEAVLATVGFVAGLKGGAQIVFDYVTAREGDAEQARRATHEALSARVASAGEPFRSVFDPARLSAQLGGLDFRTVEDVSGGDLVARYLGRAPSGRASTAHVVSAATD
jgi:methyltransferase (TIGR00027 family)